MTNREFYTKVAATTEDAEVKAFAENAIAKMDERNEKRKTTMSPTQVENEALKEKFIAFLAENGQKSAAEVASAVLDNPSTSKASSLLSQLCKEGAVDSVEVRVKGKGKHKEYFIPTESEEEA